MKNDLPPACIFEKALKINCKSTWPGLILHIIIIIIIIITSKSDLQPSTFLPG